MMGAINRISMCALLRINTSTAVGFYSNLRTGELRKTFSSYEDENDNAMASDMNKLTSINEDKDFFKKNWREKIDEIINKQIEESQKLKENVEKNTKNKTKKNSVKN